MAFKIDKQNIEGVKALKKYDIKVSGIVFILYCLVSAGTFGIEEMIPKSGPGMTLLLLMIFPIIWSYPLSNIVAECNSLLPSEGGIYAWVKEAFGEFWGFQAGWWCTISAYITSSEYVSLAVGYLSQVVPMSETAVHTLKVGIIIIFTIVNLMGLREIDKISTVLSILIIAAFILVSAVGLANWQTNPMEPLMLPGQHALDSIGSGICICIWMYCAYECISTMSGEIKRPQLIPKALLIAIPLIALTYILPTLAGLASLPAGSWQNWATDGGFSTGTVGYATVLTSHLGEMWGYIFVFIAVISQCAIFNTQLASGSRGFFVLADDYLYPRFFARVSKKRGVPYVGILSLSLVTLFLAQLKFSTLVCTEVVFILANYIILSFAALKLRKRFPAKERKKRGLYVMPGGKAGLYFCCILPVIISVTALMINGSDYFIIGVAATMTGPIAYIIAKLACGGLYKIDPLRYPINLKTRLAVGDTLRIGMYLIIFGGLSFLASFWFHWYEFDYGNWTAEEYSLFGSMIPELLIVLKWTGLVMLLIGIFVSLLAYRKDKPSLLTSNL